jgi:hypothetical protein
VLAAIEPLRPFAKHSERAVLAGDASEVDAWRTASQAILRSAVVRVDNALFDARPV